MLPHAFLTTCAVVVKLTHHDSERSSIHRIKKDSTHGGDPVVEAILLTIADYEHIDVEVGRVAMFMFINGACFAITSV